MKRLAEFIKYLREHHTQALFWVLWGIVASFDQFRNDPPVQYATISVIWLMLGMLTSLWLARAHPDWLWRIRNWVDIKLLLLGVAVDLCLRMIIFILMAYRTLS